MYRIRIRNTGFCLTHETGGTQRETNPATFEILDLGQKIRAAVKKG
jgi:hypothetical protein